MVLQTGYPRSEGLLAGICWTNSKSPLSTGEGGGGRCGLCHGYKGEGLGKLAVLLLLHCPLGAGETPRICVIKAKKAVQRIHNTLRGEIRMEPKNQVQYWKSITGNAMANTVFNR